MIKIKRLSASLLMIPLALASCSTVVHIDDMKPLNVLSDYNSKDWESPDYADLNSVILARFSYEDGESVEAIRHYEKSNRYFINRSAFDLIHIYRDMGLTDKLIDLSNRIVVSNISPVSESDFRNNVIVSIFSNIEKTDYNRHQPIIDYLERQSSENLSELDESLRRFIFVAELLIERGVNQEKIGLDRDSLSLLNYYINRMNGASVDVAVANFDRSMNYKHKLHNYMRFRELYLTGGAFRKYSREAVFLATNVQDPLLDLAILQSLSGDPESIKRFRGLFDTQYENSLHYLKLVYDIEDGDKKENISRAFMAIKSGVGYGDNATSDSIISDYIKMHIREIERSDLVDSYFSIRDNWIRFRTFESILEDMIASNDIDVELLGLLEPRYNYHIAMAMYRKEMFFDAFGWINLEAMNGGKESYESTENIDYSVLRLLILQKINPSLAVLESSRVLDESDGITDLKIVDLYIKILNGINVKASFSELRDIRVFEELNFLITSKISYRVLNDAISDYYHLIGDYEKAIEVINEFNESDYIYFAMLGKNQYKLGHIENAKASFLRSMSMLDSQHLENTLNELGLDKTFLK